jgi:hypothetical protein
MPPDHVTNNRLGVSDIANALPKKTLFTITPATYPDLRCFDDFGVWIVKFGLVFSKGLHHRVGVADLG